MLWFLIALLVLVIVVVWAVAAYNGLVKLRNLVQEAWHQIDTELQRRHDLIPNLVEIVKGYAKHERETLEAVINARNKAASATTVAEASAAQGALTATLGRLFALSEAYPDLKANTNFLALQEELTATENRV